MNGFVSHCFLVVACSLFFPLALSAQQPYWQQAPAPPAGTIVGVSPNGYFFAEAAANVTGTHAGAGLFRSEDNGTTWDYVGFVNDNLGPFAIAPDGDVYLAVNNLVYKSTDDGNTWTSSVVRSGLTLTAMTVGSNGYVYAGADSVYRSTDSGKTWVGIVTWPLQKFGNPGVSLLFADSSGDIFASANGDPIYKSTDNGNSWTQSQMPLPVCIMVAPDGYIFDAYEGYSSRSGLLFRSTDRGDSWVEVDSLYNDGFESLAAGQSGTIFGATGGGALYRSSDDGATWSQVHSDTSHFTPHIVAASASGSVLFGNYWEGYRRSSDNGNTWSKDSYGPPMAGVVSEVKAPNGDLLAQTWNDLIERSADGGATWTVSTSGLPASSLSSLFVDDAGNILVGSYTIGLYKSTDDGNSWRYTGWTGFPNCFASDSNGFIYAGCEQGVWRSTDGGQNWNEIAYPSSAIYSIAVAKNGYMYTDASGIDRSTDGGNTWTQVSFFNVMILTTNSNGDILGGVNGGIYRSTDNGNTWSQSGLSGEAVSGIVTNSIGYIFAATHYDGIFRSTDYGASWTTLDVGLTTGSIYYLFGDSAGYVYAATNDNGLFRSVQPTTGVKEISNDVPTSFSLSQNYPNPFNPSTIISYQIPVNSHVTLRVYDVLGRLVKTLVDKWENPGSYSVPFNADELASGVYFCRIDAGTFSDTKKMMVVR